MGYSTSIPPAVLVPGVGSYPTLWVYKSADDDSTTNGSGYYTNGKSLGMKLNDIVLVVDTATPLVSLCSVSVVNATTGAVTTKFGAVA
jgi:hypothetical protein